MQTPSLFERVAAALFGGSRAAGDDADRQLVDDVTELVVEMVEPRVRLHARYREKLNPCVRQAIAYLRSMAREGIEPILLARAAWSDDPRLNAFFATPDDVTACIGRSTELRAFFDHPDNREVQEAYALLGMKKEERTVFGAQLEGDKVKQDVAQTAVSFSGHRLVAPAATLAATRVEVGRRILQRLAQVVLARVVALDTKASELEQHKAYLNARLRLLNLARDGMEGIVKDPATIAADIKAVEQELKQTVDGYIEAKASLATLDGYIERIVEVFSHPEQQVRLTHTPLRLTRMGIKAQDASIGPLNELSLAELAIGDDFQAAITIVRCARREMPPKEDLVAKAERYL